MLKRTLVNLALVVCLLSFPAAAFGAESIPTSSTSSSNAYGRNKVQLFGQAQGDSISTYGFEYGKTINYGDSVNSSKPISENPNYLLNSAIGEYGSGNGQMIQSQQVAIDQTGNIFVVDRGNSRVQKFDSDGNYLLQFGTIGSGDGQLNQPQGIAIRNNGDIYVGDVNNHRILVFHSDGSYAFEIGPFAWAGGDNFYFPGDLAFDLDGNLLVASTWIYRYDPQGTLLQQFDPSGYGSHFSSLSNLAVDVQGNVYGSALNGSQIAKFDSSGNFVESFDTTQNDHQAIGYGGPLAVDASGNMFVADYQNNRIQMYNSIGDFVLEFGDSDQINWIGGMAIDSSGHIYVSEEKGIKVFTYEPEGNSYSLTVSDLACDTQYHFRSFATNSEGTSYGQDQTFTTKACPPGPSDLQVNATGRSATLNWTDDPSQVHISHYLMSFKKHADQEWSEQPVNYDEENPGVGYVTGIEPSTEYDFRVSIISNPNGNNSNDEERTEWSNVVAVSTTTLNNYTISSCEDFQSIGLNPTTHEVGDQEGNYILTKDIDCSQSQNWRWDDVLVGEENAQVQGFFPIMDPSTVDLPLNGFRGILDGNGHTISNIYQDTYLYGGIFEVLEGATVKNITFDNLSISVGLLKGSLGGLASLSEGNVAINNVKINGTVASAIESRPHLASFSFADAVTVGPNGHLYIIDGGGRKILETDTEGFLINEFGTYGSGDGEFQSPSDIAVDNAGNIYVTDRQRNDVQKFDSQGAFLGKFGSQGSDPGQFDSPYGIVVDGDGYIYVVGWSSSHPAQKFEPDFDYVKDIGTYGQSPGQLSQAIGVDLDSTGNIYISDATGRINKFDVDGEFVPGFQVEQASAPFEPSGPLSIDGSGNIFVASGIGAGVVKYNSSGEFLGLAGPVGLNFNYGAFAVAVAPDGTMYRENPNNTHLEKYDANGDFVKRIGTSGYGSGGLNLGGLIGLSSGDNQVDVISIKNSSVNVSVTLDDENGTQGSVISGGIIGFGFGSIDSTVAEGTVELIGANSYYVGGIAGYFSGEITNSHASNAIEIGGENLETLIGGGLVGMGFVQGISNDNFVTHDTHLESSYAWGSITSTVPSQMQAVGGLAGMLAGGTLIDSFSVETISVGSQNISSSDVHTNEASSVPVSGIVAMIMVDPADVSNIAFDVTLAGTDACYGMAFNPNTGQPMDPSELPCNEVNPDGSDPNHFKDNHEVVPLNDWDFENVWKTEPDEYPQLKVGGEVIVNDSPTPDSPTPGSDVSNSGGESTPKSSLSDILHSTTKSSKGTSSGITESKSEQIAMGMTSPKKSVNDYFAKLGKTTKKNDSTKEKGNKPWLILGDLSVTGSNVWDMVLLALMILTCGWSIHKIMKYRKEDRVVAKT